MSAPFPLQLPALEEMSATALGQIPAAFGTLPHQWLQPVQNVREVLPPVAAHIAEFIAYGKGGYWPALNDHIQYRVFLIGAVAVCAIPLLPRLVRFCLGYFVFLYLLTQILILRYQFRGLLKKSIALREEQRDLLTKKRNMLLLNQSRAALGDEPVKEGQGIQGERRVRHEVDGPLFSGQSEISKH